MSSRWIEIKKTSPSGKAMFVCLSCGQQSVAPTEECSSMVKVDYRGQQMHMPCSAWPMKPEEYAQRAMQAASVGAYFMGTVVLPNGKVIEVSVPVDAEVAASIVCNSVEFQLGIREAKKEVDAELEAVRAERMRWEKDRAKDTSSVGTQGYTPVDVTGLPHVTMQEYMHSLTHASSKE